MRLDPDTKTGSALLSLVVALMRVIVSALYSSCRVEIIAGREHLDALRAAPRPVILSSWHNRSVLAAPFTIRELHRKGLPVVGLASQSRDGELAARLGQQWSMPVVRGSATRGGRQALRAVYRAIVRDGHSPAMIPDGPTGPVYRLKPGVAVLAQMSQAPILPMGFAARRFWRLGSWDRLIVPRPFTRITVAIGEPQTVERGLSSEDFETERARLEALITERTRECEEELGLEGE